MTQPNFDLLKDAYAIIEGIPAENFYLNSWREWDEGATCGTIACAAGWLPLHPDFQARGLTYGKSVFGMQIKFRDREHMAALAAFFDISCDDAEELFGASCDYKILHKEIFLKRVRDFLEKHGQLSSQLERRAQQRAVAQRALAR